MPASSYITHLNTMVTDVLHLIDEEVFEVVVSVLPIRGGDNRQLRHLLF